jgi:CDP-diacylglycerol--serine O-phosphatidyltransferase
MLKHIPNLFSLSNLFCGCIAIVLLFEADIKVNAVAFFVFLGIFFDLLDGFLARKLNVQSKIGLELDSLADLVTSGLVPAIIIYRIFDKSSGLNLLFISNDMLPYLAFLITIASAYRLAKFNIQEDSKDYFIGLPVPANTILILSLLLILENSDNEFLLDLIKNEIFLIGLIFMSSYLLNSNFKLISLKFKSYSLTRENNIRYFIIISTAISLIVFGYLSIPIMFLIYFFSSIISLR